MQISPAPAVSFADPAWIASFDVNALASAGNTTVTNTFPQSTFVMVQIDIWTPGGSGGGDIFLARAESVGSFWSSSVTGSIEHLQWTGLLALAPGDGLTVGTGGLEDLYATVQGYLTPFRDFAFP